jgi:hypothetical protein
VEKQIEFICLFHHLFFLAKLAKTKGYPMFTDSFSDKFNAIQMSVNEIQNVKLDEANKSTVAGAANLKTEAGFDAISSVPEGSQAPPVSSSIFGVSFTDITKFWSEMNSKRSLTDMIAIFKQSPNEIYNWFISDVSDVPGADADSGSGSGGTGSSSSKSIVDGANLKKESADFIDAMYNKSGHGAAPPEMPPPPPPPPGENDPPPTIDEAKQKGLAAKAAETVAAGKAGRPERAASKGVAAAVNAVKSSQQRATEAAGATGGIN